MSVFHGRWMLFVSLLGAGTAWAQEHPGLREIAEQFWNASLERKPTWATEIGDHRFNDRLENLSEPGRVQWRGRLLGFQERVRKFERSTLSEADQLTYDLLDRVLSDAVLALDQPDYLMPLDALYGVQLRLPLLLVSQPFHDLNDFRRYAERLRGFPRQIEDTIANMRTGIRRGLVNPRIITERVIEQVRAQVNVDPERSELCRPLQDLGTWPQADREEARRLVIGVVTREVIPAYQRFLAFLTEKYLPVARETVGVGALPGGAERYAAAAYLNTTVRVSPGELHELGLSEVARIRQEMARIQAEMEHPGSLDEFLDMMSTTPKQRFESSAELLSAADGLLQRTTPLLPKLFGRLPKAPCVMKETEAFRAASAPVAYYNAPSEDGGRPGYYYINTYAPRDRLRFTLEALTYHEAVPGHHLQLALDQENGAIPRFRRYAPFTAYVEGWALYAEKLGYEIGGYRDAASRFGQLTFEMWRACRLVVDTGMHARNWSRQRAIEYMRANTSLALIDIEAEIDRYITWPGQALAYKVGELRIVALRKDAEKSLGERFDVRAFHDALLAGGAMPIDMLESRMRRWIAAR